MTMIDALTRLAGCSADRGLREKRGFDANVVQESVTNNWGFFALIKVGLAPRVRGSMYSRSLPALSFLRDVPTVLHSRTLHVLQFMTTLLHIRFLSIEFHTKLVIFLYTFCLILHTNT